MPDDTPGRIGMKVGRKRAGRPTTEGVEGEKSTLSIRVSAELKAWLNAEAKSSGRSLSQEAELHLERAQRDQALREQRWLPELLELAYGEQTAAVVMLLGPVIREIALMAGIRDALAGNEVNETAIDRPGSRWLDDPTTFAEVERAFQSVFDALRPPRDPARSEIATPQSTGSAKDFGNFFWRRAALVAGRRLAKLTSPEGPGGPRTHTSADAERRPGQAWADARTQAWANAVRQRLGPAAVERLRSALTQKEDKS
jgi:hypothetical protein